MTKNFRERPPCTGNRRKLATLQRYGGSVETLLSRAATAYSADRTPFSAVRLHGQWLLYTSLTMRVRVRNLVTGIERAVGRVGTVGPGRWGADLAPDGRAVVADSVNSAPTHSLSIVEPGASRAEGEPIFASRRELGEPRFCGGGVAFSVAGFLSRGSVNFVAPDGRLSKLASTSPPSGVFKLACSSDTLVYARVSNLVGPRTHTSFVAVPLGPARGAR